MRVRRIESLSPRTPTEVQLPVHPLDPRHPLEPSVLVARPQWQTRTKRSSAEAFFKESDPN